MASKGNWTLKPGFGLSTLTTTHTALRDCLIKIGAPAEGGMVKLMVLAEQM